MGGSGIQPVGSPEDVLWRASRSGAHAGRGFHYQDAVAAELAVRGLIGELSVRKMVPEGLEDVSIQLDTYWLHLQAKSRRGYRGEFPPGDLAAAWEHLAERLLLDPSARAGLVLEQPLLGYRGSGFERDLKDSPLELRIEVAAAVRSRCDPEPSTWLLGRLPICRYRSWIGSA
jgi:hypothetical protein